jgi:hypothetical protein
MVRIELSFRLTPDEFRGLLSEPLRRVFDEVVKSMVEFGIDEADAKGLMAKEMLDVLKGGLSK